MNINTLNVNGTKGQFFYIIRDMVGIVKIGSEKIENTKK